MKILHTADWHIGKILYKNPLREEFVAFFDWLLETIDKEEVDVLLISGDVFDLANPTVSDRQLYYQCLNQLVNSNVRVIITGGNHDSVGLLNAPVDILDNLNITVVGGAKDPISDELIEIKNLNGDLQLVVAAVPFLRDRDLRNQETDQQYKNRTEAIQEGIKLHYEQLGEICAAKYSNVPAIAMGHLFAKGSFTSDSEREIHIGNAAAVESSIFPEVFDYVALGHIHKPQRLDKNEYIRYSGSPIALSFSERDNDKIVILLELENGELKTPKVLPVPKFRELKKIAGDLASVKEKLAEYDPKFPMTSFLEIEILEKDFSSAVLTQVEELVASYSTTNQFKILKDRTHFEVGSKDTSQLFNEGQHIEDLTTVEVFERRLGLEQIDEQTKEDLLGAFRELIELVDQEEGK